MDALQLRDNAKSQLLEIRTIESGVEYLNKVKAIEVWAKAEKKDAELQNLIAEQKLRTQRILGKLIKDGQEAGEIAGQGNRVSNVPNRNISTLDDIGLNRKQSSTFQQIAEIPEEDFEEFIAVKKEAVNNAVSELTTSGILRLAKNVHVSNNSGENDWYTPAHIIERARAVLGTIDLDPASSELANKTVKAKKYYTKDDDGLTKKWSGNVWLNPPYSQPEISNFSKAVVEKRGEYNQILIIVNNATETDWVQDMIKISDGVCFIKRRVKFIDKNGNPAGSPLQGQVVIYIGENASAFFENFNEIGICMVRQG